MVAIGYQEHLPPASVSSHQVDIQCFHLNPPSETAVSHPEVQEAKVSKMQMASEVEDIVREVDSIMGKMIINPVDDIVDLFMRLCNLEEDVKACSKQYYGWLDKYEDEIDYSLYFQVYHKFSKMEDDYEVYNKEMLGKHRQEQESKCS
jgi:hypothetical protein